MLSIYAVIAIVAILFNQILQYKQAKDTYVMLQDSIFQNGIIDWEQLSGTETVAWIKFKNKPTIINYPVVQHKTNSFYLDRLYNKEKGVSGSIFMDKKNNPLCTDKNTILYGHNMKDGTMFHDLRYFMDPNFWKKNKEFYIYLPDGTRHTYEIFSVNQVYEAGYAYYQKFQSEEDFMDTINKLYQSSMIGAGVKVEKQDRIVTLSTCMDNDMTSTNRLIVVGVEREIKQVQSPASWYVAPADNISHIGEEISNSETVSQENAKTEK